MWAECFDTWTIASTFLTSTITTTLILWDSIQGLHVYGLLQYVEFYNKDKKSLITLFHIVIRCGLVVIVIGVFDTSSFSLSYGFWCGWSVFFATPFFRGFIVIPSCSRSCRSSIRSCSMELVCRYILKKRGLTVRWIFGAIGNVSNVCDFNLHR